jgi:Flp pilus assembly protein TadG
MGLRLPNKRGQSLVEIALVLPILIILFLGIAEVGFLLFSHVQVTNAARAGAREGSLCRASKNCTTLPTVVESAVFAEPAFLNLNGSNTNVNTQPASPGAKPPVGTPITVTVTYSHTSPLISGLIPMFPKTMPVRRTVIMLFSN